MSSEIGYTVRKYSKSWWYDMWRHFRDCLRQGLLEDRASQGSGGPPNNWRSTDYIKTETYVGKDGQEYGARYAYASFTNDAFEIWLGTKYIEHDQVDARWEFHDRTEVFRRIALWYLWRWSWGEWFGLRRWLYYKNLHRRCKKMRGRPEYGSK